MMKRKHCRRFRNEDSDFETKINTLLSKSNVWIVNCQLNLELEWKYCNVHQRKLIGFHRWKIGILNQDEIIKLQNWFCVRFIVACQNWRLFLVQLVHKIRKRQTRSATIRARNQLFFCSRFLVFSCISKAEITICTCFYILKLRSISCLLFLRTWHFWIFRLATWSFFCCIMVIMLVMVSDTLSVFITLEAD